MNCDELSLGFGKNSLPKKINIDDIRRCSEYKNLTEEEAIEMTVRDEADKTDERIFRVGELVEYSEGSFVRGYRTDRPM